MTIVRGLSNRAGFLFALVLLGGVQTASAADNGAFSHGTNFSCDVNTRQCTCSGIWEGADCQAMARNCDTSAPILHFCHIAPPYSCTCTLRRIVPTQRRPAEGFGRQPPAVANP